MVYLPFWILERCTELSIEGDAVTNGKSDKSSSAISRIEIWVPCRICEPIGRYCKGFHICWEESRNGIDEY